MRKMFLLFILCLAPYTLNAASVIATINGTPITDADIVARVKLMTAQGHNYTDNRKRALNNIIDDSVKIKYAENFKITPTDDEVNKQLKQMNMTSLSGTEREMAKSAIKADIAWQIVIARTIMPTIAVNKEEIASETAELE